MYLQKEMEVLTLFVVFAVLTNVARKGECTAVCPNDSSLEGGTKPLYLLMLAPFPDPSDGTRWDEGLATVSGARVARDEVNNRTDLLPGYHIELIVENVESCSRTRADTGLTNLVKYTVSPACRPVVAVTGLLCSSHTTILSPVAGHDGYDLLQLSAANSPIFQTQNQLFPHLWRFLGSATAYTDAIIAIMNQFNWNRIGIVFDSGNVFYTENAKYLRQQLVVHNKSAVIFSEIRDTNQVYFDSVVSGIKSNGVTVLAAMLNEAQTSKLLEMALREHLTYPDYTWIHIETIMAYLIDENLINRAALFSATQGHILLHTLTRLQNNSLKLVSGDTYEEVVAKYHTDLEVLRQIYNTSDLSSNFIFGSYIYDEVWALALALNDSFPVLNKRNLSIDNYSIGQLEITDVIEEHLENVSFQGAGGWVEFNDNRAVTTSVEVFLVLENGTDERVGIFKPRDAASFRVELESGDLPRDTPPLVFISIPLPVAILLYIIDAALITFITVQLILYIYYRNHKVIKATSPYLSLLMFAGCYLLCVVVAIKVTYGTFDLPEESFIMLLFINIFIVLNGFSLILVTLFFKLLRVYRIFLSRLQIDLGRYWNNFPLLIAIICITVLPNIIVVPFTVVFMPEYSRRIVYVTSEQLRITEIHVEFKSTGYFVTGGLIACYVAIFSFIILFLSIRTRKIKHKNFKDTKKLNIFVSVLMFTLAFTAPLYIIFLLKENAPAANIVFVIAMLVISAASQFILFLPKVLPTVLSSIYPSWESLYSTMFLSSRTINTL